VPAARRREAFAHDMLARMADMTDVQARPMFGGHGLFRHGLMFAIAMDERLYFKTDAESAPAFEQHGLQPFRYTDRHGREGALRYHEAPAEVYEDPQAMHRWAMLGWETALRAQARPARSRTAARTAARKESKPVKTPVALTDLPNLGPASAAMLVKAGIRTVAALRRLGAVRAFVRTRAACPGASLNLLWALEGALTGRPWQAVAAEDRAALLMALEDARGNGLPGVE
jgi:DNA transformation protein